MGSPQAEAHDFGALGVNAVSGSRRIRGLTFFWLAIALSLTCLVYWPGLSGSWIFDDYPSIVDNAAVQPANLSAHRLVDAALSSTASDFKRPLASLSFALNYRATGGLDPFWMKLSNLFIHLLNGILVFLLSRSLLRAQTWREVTIATPQDDAENRRTDTTAVLIAAAWLLLPINLTCVLYVVQRMESMANAFVLLGLLGYVGGRRRMLRAESRHQSRRGLALCATSLGVATALGALAKETAVMLPLYALLAEVIVFRRRRLARATLDPGSNGERAPAADRHIWILFGLLLVVPMFIGLAWLLPRVLDPQSWASRDFTMRTRLLSEARIVFDYIHWSLLPTSHGLKFYYDDFPVSSSLLNPWTTLVAVIGVGALVIAVFGLRNRAPMVAVGISWFLGAHLLTATILPLELVFEHRNYFASFGLLLALVPLLAGPGKHANEIEPSRSGSASPPRRPLRVGLPFPLVRHVLLGALMVLWTINTALGAYTWGAPLRLAQDLAARSPTSPRAQYNLGRTYSIYSNHDPASPFTGMAYEALERAARLPGASILPEQALIYMNALMHSPPKDQWWDRLVDKLRNHVPTAQDESALRALSICAIEKRCDLPQDRMRAAFDAALEHPHPGAQLQARYGDYAWTVLGDKSLGERMMARAVKSDPNEPDYQIAHIRMLIAEGRRDDARLALRALESRNLVTRPNAMEKLKVLLENP